MVREININAETLDIWFDNRQIKCPKCGKDLTNILTNQITDLKCDSCGKEFELHVKFFLFNADEVN